MAWGVPAPPTDPPGRDEGRAECVAHRWTPQDPKEQTSIRHLVVRKVPTVSTGKPLYEMLNLFQTGRSRPALAGNPGTPRWWAG